MALISEESLERVKQAADIVEVVSAHTDLRRQGARWVGLCPFHEERTPSFSVDAQEKLYHCFGCGVGGDTIKFVEEKEGLGFAEAVELLADRYGVELRAREGGPAGRGAAPAAAPARRAARPHRRLLRRTTSGTPRRRARRAPTWPSAGWARRRCAPSASATRRAPGTRCCCAGSGPASRSRSCARVGLAQRGRGGGEYDRFRERIMFPIRDRRGRTLGFGGRAMRSDQGAKYVNTAETDFFHKSQHALRDRPGQGGDRQERAGRSWSRATPTCWRCTRRGSARRSG